MLARWQTEAGTHLFLPKHGGPLPLRVDVLDTWPAVIADPFAFGPILRVYAEGQPVADSAHGVGVATARLAPTLAKCSARSHWPRCYAFRRAWGRKPHDTFAASFALNAIMGLTPHARQKGTMPTARYHALLCCDAAGGYSAMRSMMAPLASAPRQMQPATTCVNISVGRTVKKFGGARRTSSNRNCGGSPSSCGRNTRAKIASTRPMRKCRCECRASSVMRKSGQFTADLPLLELRFEYANRTELDKLVERYVSQKLEGLTPAQLAAFLPPGARGIARKSSCRFRKSNRAGTTPFRPRRRWPKSRNRSATAPCGRGYARAWSRSRTRGPRAANCTTKRPTYCSPGKAASARQR